MIDALDRQLREWIGSVVKDAEVDLGAPPASAKDTAVSCYLLDVQNAVPVRGGVQRSFELAARYLVTVAGDDAEAAHRVLGELIFAALARPDWQVELRSHEPEFWAAFGVAPRPALILRCPLVVERPQRVQRVRHPAEFRIAPVVLLNGVVVTADDVPIPRARVEIAGTQAVTFTDDDGHFQLSALPPRDKRDATALTVTAKGIQVLVANATRAAKPLVIRIDPKEP
jgi:Carboxypeptidase regulatory-like domain